MERKILREESLSSEDNPEKFKLSFSPFGGQYVLGDKIGQGAFGKVYKLRRFNQTKEYAVKVIERNYFSEVQQERIYREAMILRKLKHPNIVRFENIDQTDQQYYILMELIEGGSLRNFYRQRRRERTPITEEEASLVMKKLLSAVEYLHNKDIIHRDIKPDNILIKNRNDLKTIKLADFGLSTEFTEVEQSIWAKKNCGTKAYMAPEMLNKDQTYSKPVDIWSCGITMYTLLHKGKHPFYKKGDSLEEFRRKLQEMKIKFRPDLSDLAKDFFRKLIEIDPADRYTALNASNHPWLTRNLQDSIPFSINQKFNIFGNITILMRVIKTLQFIKFIQNHRVNTYSLDR